MEKREGYPSKQLIPEELKSFLCKLHKIYMYSYIHVPFPWMTIGNSEGWEGVGIEGKIDAKLDSLEVCVLEAGGGRHLCPGLNANIV